MNKDYCDCTGCSSDSEFMLYSDYDDLIERLKSTRNEIDDLIHILEDRKKKDDVINSILASDCEEETTKEDEELLNKIFDGKIGSDNKDDDENVFTHRIYIPPYKQYTYPFRWYPTFWYKF